MFYAFFLGEVSLFRPVVQTFIGLLPNLLMTLLQGLVYAFVAPTSGGPHCQAGMPEEGGQNPALLNLYLASRMDPVYFAEKYLSLLYLLHFPQSPLPNAEWWRGRHPLSAQKPTRP